MHSIAVGRVLPRISPLMFGLVVFATAPVSAQTTSGKATGSAKEAPSASQEFPIKFQRIQIAGANDELGLPLDMAVGTDGSVYLVDWPNRHVVRYDSAGSLVWKVGRRGRGPGEFEGPTRVGLMADGSIVVYDQAQDRFSRFDNAGKHIADFRLELTLRQINNVVGLPGGGLAVSGVNRSNPDAAFGVHVFNPEYQHVTSFGPLPPVENADLRAYVGAGTLSRTAENELVYVPWYPYSVYRYTPTGKLQSSFSSSLPLVGTPDNAYRIEMRGTQKVTVSTNKTVRPVGAIHLKQGIYVARRRGPDTYNLDAFDSAGQWLGSHSVPAKEWSGVMAYDPIREVLWVIGTKDDVPVLYRVPIVVTRIR